MSLATTSVRSDGIKRRAAINRSCKLIWSRIRSPHQFPICMSVSACGWKAFTPVDGEPRQHNSPVPPLSTMCMGKTCSVCMGCITQRVVVGGNGHRRAIISGCPTGRISTPIWRQWSAWAIW